MGELLKAISENPELILEFTTEQIAEARAELEALSRCDQSRRVGSRVSEEIAEAVRTSRETHGT